MRRVRRLRVGVVNSHTAPRVAGGGGIPAVGYSGTTESGGSSWVRKTGHMETFKKRQKEMRRLERQKDKEARRIQRKQNRAGSAGDTSDDTPPAGQDGSPSVE